MKKLFTSALLSVAAAPFLVAAPAAKTAQNAVAQTATSTKPAKKHVKKSKAANKAAQTGAAPANSSPAK